MLTFKKRRYSVDEYASAILNGDRMMLSKAITLIESKLHDDNVMAEEVIDAVLPYTGNAIRIGITGVPGAGKSTFIESFGKYLTSINKKVAVLTIDPSSQRTQGSILGDKTRMELLANDENAFVRPSASGNTLGGIHSKTREAMLLCEAAGFDVIIIETVGVGQNETSVKNIVDFFLLILIAGGGDELQGIKRGIVEVSDAIIINKADGDNINRAELSKREYQNALHMLSASENGWTPTVLTCSALNNKGIQGVWTMICEYEKAMKSTGFFLKQRQHQNIKWMNDLIQQYLSDDFNKNKKVKEQLKQIEKQIVTQEKAPITAARLLYNLYKKTSDAI